MQNRKPDNNTRQLITDKGKIRRNIRLILAFDGTAYHGWQAQENAPTLQGALAKAIMQITGERVTLTGSGRTDAGTHARRLVANFLTESRIGPGQLLRALNSILPNDIRILSARQMSPDFHSRRNAVSKVYRYQVYLGPILMPHLIREFFHFPYPIDIGKMEKAARLFVGEHDFASFAKANSAPVNTIRRILRFDLKKRGHRLLMTVEGNGFLHHMVRNMAGTLLEVGCGSISLEAFRELFVLRDRTLAGFTAPAHGLVLLKVQY
jgi:tRNA pseudouridine38-40 synthase